MTTEDILYLIKHGYLKRPERCERCRKKKKTKSGRTSVHAHHCEYNDSYRYKFRHLEKLKKPKILWLCSLCHFEWHMRFKHNHTRDKPELGIKRKRWKESYKESFLAEGCVYGIREFKKSFLNGRHSVSILGVRHWHCTACKITINVRKACPTCHKICNPKFRWATRANQHK